MLLRLTEVSVGLVAALGCLFTSFSNKPHQVFLSYGLIFGLFPPPPIIQSSYLYSGVGASLLSDTAELIVGQYFKRRRAMVEMIIECSRAIGHIVFNLLLEKLIK